MDKFKITKEQKEECRQLIKNTLLDFLPKSSEIEIEFNAIISDRRFDYVTSVVITPLLRGNLKEPITYKSTTSWSDLAKFDFTIDNPFLWLAKRFNRQDAQQIEKLYEGSIFTPNYVKIREEILNKNLIAELVEENNNWLRYKVTTDFGDSYSYLPTAFKQFTQLPAKLLLN